MLLNPALSVRGERYQVVEGKTPEITVRGARQLLAAANEPSMLSPSRRGLKPTAPASSLIGGLNPYAGLVEGTDGNLYGTTVGSSYLGTVFKITTAGVLTTLYTFSGSDGEAPYGTLVQATDGNLYGTTSAGGTNGFSTRDLLQIESPEGCFVKTNESLTQLLGYSGTGLCRTAIFDLVSPDDLPAVFNALETLEKGAHAVNFECRCRVADGSFVVLQWSVSKHAATGFRYWVGRNVTERKRTEALLAGQAKAIDASHAVIEFSLDGTIIAANERFLALMKYRGDHIIGRQRPARGWD